MARTKEILTAVGTLCCAVGIGFVMQNSENAKARYGTGAASIEDMPELTEANAMLDVQEITLTSAEFDTNVEMAKPEPETVLEPQVIQVAATQDDVQPEEETQAAPTLSCEINAEARPVAGAMVELSMTADCLPNERVTVHHNGMIFTETTSDKGDVTLRVPALSQDAVFILAFTNGEGAVAQTTVEELANYDRSVLQWKGNTGFEIHAREFGADYGSKGHIWDGAPGTIADAVAGSGGVMTRHGDINAPEPLLAEVYTFPKRYDGTPGTISISVETEVTDSNCGLEIEAQSLEMQPDGSIKTQNLTLPVPDCDAQGSFLVLNNLLQDLKVAGS